MSGSQFIAISSQPYSLSDATSSIVYRIPELLRRLRDLEKEEVELNVKARQLVGQLPQTKDAPSTPTRPIISNPVSKLRSRATESTVERGTPSTPPHIDPRTIETPVKTFLLMESFALAMSIKSKRRGRIFMSGGSTEFGERR